MHAYERITGIGKRKFQKSQNAQNVLNAGVSCLVGRENIA